MNTRVIAVFILSLLIQHGTYAQNCWLEKADIPGPGRYSGIGFSVGWQGYVGLGANSTFSYLDDFYEYSVLTGAWLQKASFPGEGIYSPTSFSINGIGYVCCGFSSGGVCQTEVWSYDPAADTWAQMAPFPGQARYGASAFVIGDSAYLVAGSFNNGSNYLYDLWMYNSINDTWTQKSDFPGANRCHGVAFSIFGKGYFGTGLAETNIAASDFWQYNPGTDTWSAIANFPGMPRMGAVSYVINNNGFVGSGYDLVNEYNDFWRYEPVSDTWIPSCPVSGASGRRVGVCFTIMHMGFYGAGYSDDNGSLNDFWEFRPTLDVPETQTQKEGFRIYPNPTQGDLFIDLFSNVSPDTRVMIFDVSGRLLLNQTINNEHNTKIRLPSDISNGFYYYCIRSHDKINDTGILLLNKQ
jgi:N-acetylneuraminic acid mutarotase